MWRYVRSNLNFELAFEISKTVSKTFSNNCSKTLAGFAKGGFFSESAVRFSNL